MDADEPNATASVASAIERELQETYFDTGQYIAAVKALPVLWDSSTEDYSSRVLRNRAWQTLVDKYGGTNLTKKKDRNELLQQLRKKWTNLRAAYTRELKRQTGLKAYAAKSEYIYFQQLNFLEHIVCPQGAENIGEAGELGSDQERETGNIERVAKQEDKSEPIVVILADSDDEDCKILYDTSKTGGSTCFKTLDFIADIKMRPAIWDPNADGFRSAGAKRRCWNEIVEKYGPHLSPLKKKNLEYKLKNEWRSMQNSFWRVVRRSGDGEGPGSRDKYEYFRQLQFLNKVTAPKQNGEDHEFVEVKVDNIESIENGESKESDESTEHEESEENNEPIVEVSTDNIESVENGESKEKNESLERDESEENDESAEHDDSEENCESEESSDDSSGEPKDGKRKIDDIDSKLLEDECSHDDITLNQMHTIKIEETRTHTQAESFSGNEIQKSRKQILKVEHIQVETSSDELRETPEHIRKRRKHTQYDATSEDTVENCQTPRLQDMFNDDDCGKDEDRLFLLSLLKTLKSVPESKKMTVKNKMMNLLEDAAKEHV